MGAPKASGAKAAAAPKKVSPLPSPTPASPLVETPATEQAPVVAPVVEQVAVQAASAETSAPVAAQPVTIEEAAAAIDAELSAPAQRAALEAFRLAQMALRDALDALDDLALQTVHVGGREQALVDVGLEGAEAVRAVLRVVDERMSEVGAAFQYGGEPRRLFAPLKDVLHDGESYSPDGDRLLPLTEGQFAELKAASAVEGEWDDGKLTEDDDA